MQYYEEVGRVFGNRGRQWAVTGIAISGVVAMSGCAGGAGESGDGKVDLTYLTQGDEINVTQAQALKEAFEAEYPDITITINTTPGGGEGDNLVRTKIATGEMEDVLHYNAGSQLEAIHPDETLIPLADEDWAGTLTDEFIEVVGGPDKVYGAPFGTTAAGGILYNKKVYEQLDLEVPTTWDEFMANSEKIKDSGTGIAPIIQTFGDTWTSQLFVLADFANVISEDPAWADDYTAGKAKYADQPALRGFQYQQETFDAGLYNSDYASAGLTQGLKLLASGQGAQYPMLTGTISQVIQDSPDQVEDIGYFALPADDAADTAATIWQPMANFIPRTTSGDELEAAKLFVAFANSEEGCRIQNELAPPSGPYATSLCSLPDDAPPILLDVQKYFDEGRAASALEFLSPIKGPNLENITVEVGSGISTAEQGAAAYDEDVKKQAQQLGIEGW